MAPASGYACWHHDEAADAYTRQGRAESRGIASSGTNPTSEAYSILFQCISSISLKISYGILGNT